MLPAESVGREYLTNLRENATRTRERQTRARAVSFQMHRLFIPLDEEVSCRLTESGKMVLDIAHLIDRKYVERYQNKFATTSAMMRECLLQLSGPWPPYHFVHRLTRSVSCAGASRGGPASAAGSHLRHSDHGVRARAGLDPSRLSKTEAPSAADGASVLLLPTRTALTLSRPSRSTPAQDA